MSVIIVGGGIQGVCSAYYLLKNFGIKATIIEKTSVACAASGKAGGFLAREWGSESTIPLHHHSFDMHKELAQTHSISSYRILPTLSVNSNTTGKKLASWLDGNCTTSHMDDVTAQVTPSEFTGKLLLECTNAGVNFVIGSVNELLFDKTLNKIGGVKLESGETYLADAVLLAMGPWTGVAIEDWLSIPFPMEGIKSSSIILKEINSNDLLNEPYALFCEEDNNNCHLEIYPRPNSDLYICGLGGSDIVKGDRLRPFGDCGAAEKVQPNFVRVKYAFSSLSSITSVGNSHIEEYNNNNDTEKIFLSACMRPCLTDANPALGKICNGLFSNTGHNCWGILWAPACGKALAGLIAKDLFEQQIFKEEDYRSLNNIPIDISINFHDIIMENYKFFDLVYHRDFDPLRFCSNSDRVSLLDLNSHFETHSSGLIQTKGLSHSMSQLFLLSRGRKQGEEVRGEQW